MQITLTFDGTEEAREALLAQHALDWYMVACETDEALKRAIDADAPKGKPTYGMGYIAGLQWARDKLREAIQGRDLNLE